MNRFGKRSGPARPSRERQSRAIESAPCSAALPLKAAPPAAEFNHQTAVHASILIAVAIGVGTLLDNWLKGLGVTRPADLGPMLVAALMRKLTDWCDWQLPMRQFDVVGHVSLAFFLAMALMSMKLWELAQVAGPLVVILLAQTAVMFG